jgi:hypothetical protein
VAHLETNTDRRDGVTLVEGWAKNDGDGHRRIAIEVELDGPIWPPRREGVPERGWDREDGRLTATLSPGERYGFGFATPAAPSDPPVTLVSDEPGQPSEGIERSPAGVVRALGDPSPPVDLASTPDAPDGRTGGDRNRRPPPDDSNGTGTAPAGTGVDRAKSRTDRPRSEGDAGGTGAGAIGGYPAVTAWLSAVEHRIDRAGSDGKRGEEPTLVGDADRLRSVAGRAVRLAERADQARRRLPGRGPE